MAITLPSILQDLDFSRARVPEVNISRPRVPEVNIRVPEVNLTAPKAVTEGIDAIGERIESLTQRVGPLRRKPPEPTAPVAAVPAALVAGVGIGLGIMWLIDPAEGRRRRALIADQIHRVIRSVRGALGGRANDIRNRAQGVAATGSGAISSIGGQDGGTEAGTIDVAAPSGFLDAESQFPGTSGTSGTTEPALETVTTYGSSRSSTLSANAADEAGSPSAGWTGGGSTQSGQGWSEGDRAGATTDAWSQGAGASAGGWSSGSGTGGGTGANGEWPREESLGSTKGG